MNILFQSYLLEAFFNATALKWHMTLFWTRKFLPFGFLASVPVVDMDSVRLLQIH